MPSHCSSSGFCCCCCWISLHCSIQFSFAFFQSPLDAVVDVRVRMRSFRFEYVLSQFSPFFAQIKNFCSDPEFVSPDDVCQGSHWLSQSLRCWRWWSLNSWLYLHCSWWWAVIKNLYGKATSAVLFNSSVGDWFRTTVRVWQGCLLLCTLFNIFMKWIMTDALEDLVG